MDGDRQIRERQFWDKFAVKYDSFMKNLQPAYDMIVQKIARYVEPSSDILEVAVGTGIIASRLAPLANRVCACDISPEMVKVAREKMEKLGLGNVELSVQDAYDLDYPPESFDAVIASNVLHVMIHPEKTLASVQRVLKADGVFIAPTYCHGDSLKSRAISWLMSLAGFKAFHKWSVESFRIFLAANHYEIIEFEVIRDKIPLVFAAARKDKAP
ncbi:MAG: class I SAM-dependent methyltransferase [Desulfatibacillum sp.]|nr:class I SAM-dependent methyltransferase [Desulfatibacillum sp.]